MLEVSQINLHYGESQALRQVDLRVAVGEVCCVLGRNGVGKTSLLRAIVGQHAISAGSITWNGEELSRLPAFRRARSGIAFVPQGREIFPQLSVLENLETGLGCLPRSERQIDPYIYDLFPVLRDMLHRRGGDLSGGQQQQLAIARALVTQPKLLVLDEPTEGIQPSIIKDIAEVIVQLRREGNMGILLVEQYFDFAHELGDTIVVLDRGQVVLAGANADLPEADVRRYLTV